MAYRDNSPAVHPGRAGAAMAEGHDNSPAVHPGRAGAAYLFDFSDSLACSSSLNKLMHKDTGRLRLMYYGDSQIEGDRITCRLREELRKILPGTGPGLLSITPLVPYTRTSYVRSSANWHSYDYLKYSDGQLDHNRLGPMMSVSRFTEPGAGDDEVTTAWFSVEPSMFADTLSATYNLFRLFYGNLEDTLNIEIHDGRGLLKRDTLFPSAREKEYVFSLDSSNFLKLVFEGKTSPDFYGFSLESSHGAIVDNIPRRGSAGLEYTMMSGENLEALYSILSPDIIMLHYGLNVVLNVRSSYKYYEDGIYKQLEMLRHLCPETVIVLLGITDMAHRVDGDFQSYENIPSIRDAQKKAAERAGVLFWDSWEAMGGMNSIIEWSRKDPPLASDDYTHLTYAGGDTLADLLLRDILYVQMRPDKGLAETAIKADTVPVVISAVDTVTDSDIRSTTGRIICGLLSYDQGEPLLFSRASFWIFLFGLMLFYSLLFKKPLFRNTYLFLFSLFFYYKSGGVFFFLLIISTLTDYTTGLIIHRARKKTVRKIFVFLSLLVNLGMLSYFKYTGFFTGIFNDIFNTELPVIDWFAAVSNFYFGTGFNIDVILLPVGISFFTFQTISYTLDVYRGKTEPVRNILDFGFYVSFFPQLVAGPIVRASDFVPQLYAPFRLSGREWSHALFLVIGGLIKKIIISDFIAVNFVDRVFDTPLMYSGLENLMAIYGYGLQIYCDFSGYTDIAIGIALMLGYRLPVNFNSPYKAHNLSDFWRRWHISLSRWLKDYLYISLGGNRKGNIRTYLNLMITMLLGGLWHGAAWRFVLWGGLHGLGLVVNKLWLLLFPGRRRETRLKRLISVFITFNFVSFCWIFFRATDLESVTVILRQVFTAFSPGSLVNVFTAYSQVIIVMLCGYILHFLPVKVKESYRGLFISLPLVVKIILVYLVALVLYNVQSADIQPFIYFRF
jgi:D-alanyl-lipoteichoic acid acyltransferase DltB (MBOAT superfamily)